MDNISVGATLLTTPLLGAPAGAVRFFVQGAGNEFCNIAQEHYVGVIFGDAQGFINWAQAVLNLTPLTVAHGDGAILVKCGNLVLPVQEEVMPSFMLALSETAMGILGQVNLQGAGVAIGWSKN